MVQDTARKAILLTLLAALGGYALFDTYRDDAPAHGPSPVTDRVVGAASATAETAPRDEKAGRWQLPERAPLAEPRAQLFGHGNWQPPPPKTEAAPAAPVAPPLPYRFAGVVRHGDHSQVLLSKGDVVFSIREGETLDGAYRVESITDSQVSLLYMPLKQKETIPVSTALAPPGGKTPGPAAASTAPALAARAPADTPARSSPPVTATAAVPPAAPAAAKPGAAPIPTTAVVASALGRPGDTALLLWQGPQQVKVGSRFDVTLKMSSAQPVLASPMQLRFDPSQLELVAAKAGKFFAGAGDRSFIYRASPDGSVFIGASNRSAASASDAELLVLTFRPVRPAPVAELSLSSLSLQGPSGRSIAFDPLAAFKMAVTP